ELLISIFLFHGWNDSPYSNRSLLMSNANNSPSPDDISDVKTLLQQMQEQLQQQFQTQLQQQLQHQQQYFETQLRNQQARIQELEDATDEQDGKVVYKHTRATTLKPYERLVNNLPAIAEENYYTAELPPNHDVFEWSDFHYTETMDYKAPAVMEHAEVSLPGPLKKVDDFLAA
ncbi:hypothetical protein BGZ79_006273, partial [Entomortierella chlamydospora]